MSLNRILELLLAIALFTSAQQTMLKAEEQYGWVKGHYRGPVPYYIGNPRTIPIAEPRPVVLNTKTKQPSPISQVEASPRAYPYGYFGVQYRPYSVSQSNYYKDFSQWSFRRGY
jgi:hypothetical protein